MTDNGIMYTKEKNIMELKGSKTEANLNAAFAGESMATNKYTYFASVAKKEGYEQIAAFFLENAQNEKEHAKLWAKKLGLISDTKTNLGHGVEGEHYEWESMYPEFAKVAREEGFKDIAALFEAVGAIEKNHEIRYQKLLDNVNNNAVFAKPEPEIWICRNCGYESKGKDAPHLCPVCDHPQAHFMVKKINY